MMKIILLIFFVCTFCCSLSFTQNKENIVSVINSYSGYQYSVLEKKLEVQTTLFRLNGNINESIISVLDENSIIIILGVTPWFYSQIYTSEYYLVNVKNSKTCWSGWIRKKDVLLSDSEEKKLRNFECLGFSNDDKYFAFSTGLMKSIIVVDKQGNKIIQVKINDLIKIDPNSVDSHIIGWSSDSKYAWFYTNMDAYRSSYGRINIQDIKYELIKRPKNFKSNQIAIDLDTGNTIYTDYPFQFDTESAAITKKSGKPFNLYKNNMLDPREIILDTNFGVGFNVQKNKDNKLLYVKNKESKIVEFTDTENFSTLENKIFRVTTNLRLRLSPEISGAVIATMQNGMYIKVVEIGNFTTIDNIDGNWVKIEVTDDAKDKDNKMINKGTTGWCFSGYLD